MYQNKCIYIYHKPMAKARIEIIIKNLVTGRIGGLLLPTWHISLKFDIHWLLVSFSWNLFDKSYWFRCSVLLLLHHWYPLCCESIHHWYPLCCESIHRWYPLCCESIHTWYPLCCESMHHWYPLCCESIPPLIHFALWEHISLMPSVLWDHIISLIASVLW